MSRLVPSECIDEKGEVPSFCTIASETGASEQDDVITETLRSQKRNACVREVGQVSVVPIICNCIMSVGVSAVKLTTATRQL